MDCVSRHVDDALDYQDEMHSFSQPAWEFLVELTEGVLDNHRRIDGLIAEYAPDWPISQMAMIDPQPAENGYLRDGAVGRDAAKGGDKRGGGDSQGVRQREFAKIRQRRARLHHGSYAVGTGRGMMMQLDKIHHADAFDILPQLDDESVDLIICDGPYGVTTNEWDRVSDIQNFNLRLIEIFSKKMKDGAALYLFGKPDCIDFIDYRPYLNLRSKIVWYQPSRLAQGRISYTNNYDIICYFVKGSRPKTFGLDAIRVPQLVELEHRLRCERVPSRDKREVWQDQVQRKRQESRGRLGGHQAVDVPIQGVGQQNGAEYHSET